MRRQIAVFGGSFNPPAKHHREIAARLSREFDEVVVVPCGPRPDKLTVGDIEPLHRAVMADLTFRGLPRVRVELFDLERGTFTRTRQLDEMFRGAGEVWHAVGTDLLVGGGDGKSLIHEVWERGPELWHELNFAVINRPDYAIRSADLPPRHRLIAPGTSGASTEIRERAFRRQPLDGLVTPEVEAYVERHNLYRGTPPSRASALNLCAPRPLVVVDEQNPAACRLAKSLSDLATDADPNCIAVVGGDGAMIAAIREHWRRRLPFIGLNAGHRGHLLNEPSDLADLAAFAAQARTHQLPLIYVEVEGSDGQVAARHAVNDAWVERAAGQAAWLEVKIDGVTGLPRLVADGLLTATPAGSTAYARAMGAKPLLIGSREWLLVGSNVIEPVGWKTAPLPLEAEIEIVNLDPVKRPLRAFVDSVEIGPASRAKFRISRVAAAEVAFAPARDMAAKFRAGLFSPAA